MHYKHNPLLFTVSLFCCLFTFFNSSTGYAADKVIQLPVPEKTGGMSLLEALNLRKTVRIFVDKPVPEQDLANLLWAGQGINRAPNLFTTPAAQGIHDTKIYVCKADGVWLYNPFDNQLVLVSTQDTRKILDPTNRIAHAPVFLVYVSNAALWEDNQQFIPTDSYMHVGAIYQNVSLYCAAKGLNTVIRRGYDIEELRKALKLTDAEKIIISQTIGWLR